MLSGVNKAPSPLLRSHAAVRRTSTVCGGDANEGVLVEDRLARPRGAAGVVKASRPRTALRGAEFGTDAAPNDELASEGCAEMWDSCGDSNSIGNGEMGRGWHAQVTWASV